MTWCRIAAAIAFPWLVGLGLVRAVPEVWAVRSLRWGIAFGLGSGVLTLEMLVFAQMGWAWRPGSLAPIPALAALAATVWGRRDRGPARGGRGPFPRARQIATRVVLLLILLALMGAAVLRAAVVPLSGWDAFAIWGFKGRAFHVDGTVRPEFLVEPSRLYSHPEYPLHVPLLMTWIGLVLGEWDERLVLLGFPAYYAALLLVVYGALAPGRSVEATLGWTAAAATCPSLTAHATVALADLPLAYAVAATATMLAPGSQGDDRRRAALAGALGGIGAWTKSEGLAWLVVLAACLTLRSLLAGERRRGSVGLLGRFLG